MCRSTLALFALVLSACGGSDGKADAAAGGDFKVDSAALTKTASGLQYQDVTVGSGGEASDGQVAVVHYTGWLTNGKQFDSSVGGEPVTFGLNEVIKGWTLGIPGMKPGGVRRLKIPSELGYGERGAGADIPPNSTLVFEVKLVK